MCSFEVHFSNLSASDRNDSGDFAIPIIQQVNRVTDFELVAAAGQFVVCHVDALTASALAAFTQLVGQEDVVSPNEITVLPLEVCFDETHHIHHKALLLSCILTSSVHSHSRSRSCHLLS